MAGNRFRDFSDVGPNWDGLFDRELRAENDASGTLSMEGMPSQALQQVMLCG